MCVCVCVCGGVWVCGCVGVCVCVCVCVYESVSRMRISEEREPCYTHTLSPKLCSESLKLNLDPNLSRCSSLKSKITI